MGGGGNYGVLNLHTIFIPEYCVLNLPEMFYDIQMYFKGLHGTQSLKSIHCFCGGGIHKSPLTSMEILSLGRSNFEVEIITHAMAYRVCINGSP